MIAATVSRSSWCWGRCTPGGIQRWLRILFLRDLSALHFEQRIDGALPAP
jgi:hypothetical protein